ncbi:UPF0609 protein C4orf27 [Trichoplax sp. H2]|uniref:Histone PARylation factor 1 n=1 Tax=Trichoplax adhaerens TaxID=10228 RepID=B3S2G9_TRIAD|nr:hypothetical protein TRIADDRAFT_58020 [Trichoplax adhaerens]EDV23415.1 hypothetical protein TRIADDRAFT_58020 [Trichoplax adhaerens]RDD47808.1 UPF0609 protein C4orf27 [Trichoplax sp. H2]|eukprot:XP_002114325.1 hypothetical protein TRIADDRAFT_58020 [Trichoplax adhaerens]
MAPRKLVKKQPTASNVESSGKRKNAEEEFQDSVPSNKKSKEHDSEIDYSKRIEFMKAKFGVTMPDDFFRFYEFCQEVNPTAPSDALMDTLQLKLVGAFDVLAGQFDDRDESSITSYYLHWRFYYDPPEMMTLLAREDESSYHFGYYRDDPDKLPDLVASNTGGNSCELKCMGTNLFAAVKTYIDNQLNRKAAKKEINELASKLQEWAARYHFDLSVNSKSVKERKKYVVANTFHTLGIVVPVDKKLDIGYRPLNVTNAALGKILTNIEKCKNTAQRLKFLEPLEELITYVQFANDECDYGMGLELGIDLFCRGEEFNNFALHLLTTAYSLLRRPLYADIISIHMTNRKRSCLSQLQLTR